MTGNEIGEEMLEEWDWQKACPTGKPVPRSRAHREGIAHEGVHLWVIRCSPGGTEVLFQHRAGHKENYPNCLDITVGGHVPFGKVTGKIQKEAFEEIGISPPDEDLVDLGVYRYEEQDENMFHREFQRVYLYFCEQPLEEYRFNDGEVDGIFAVPLESLERLLEGDITFEAAGFDGEKCLRRCLSRSDFHPLLFTEPMKVYMEVVMASVKGYLREGRVANLMPAPGVL